MIPELRQYQVEAIAAVRSALEQGKRRFVINVPTGCGKTILALNMCASSMRKGNRVLWIAHREELIQQTIESLADRVAPDLAGKIGVVKADRDENEKQFVVASIQTLWGKDRDVEKRRRELKEKIEELGDDPAGSLYDELNRLPAPSYPRWESLKPDSFSVIVYDECHHSMSDSVMRLFETLKPSEKQMILGLSATPFRADERSLRGIFSDGIVYQLALRQAIRSGYLCDFKYASAWLDIDLDKIKTTAGDYNAEQLEAALEEAGVVDATVEGIRQHAPDRKALVFTFTIAQAANTAKALCEAGFAAEFLSCDTGKAERAEMLKRFKRGETKYLCNCAVLTEGYDGVTVDCIAIVRPTQSKSLYQQMVGRGLRIDPNNPGKHCLVLDFTGTSRKKMAAGVVDLIGVVPQPGETSEQAEIRIAAEEEAKGLPKDPVAAAMLNAAVAAKSERDSWKSAWVVVRGRVSGVKEARVLSGRAKRKCVIWCEDGDDETNGSWKVAAWLPNSGGVFRLERRGISLDFAESISRTAMKEMGQRGIFDATAAWRIRPPSRAALQFAQKCKIEVDQNWSGGEVADAINSVTAGWDLKKLIANKEVELAFDSPEDFRAALRAERDASEQEYEEKKEARRQEVAQQDAQQTEVPF